MVRSSSQDALSYEAYFHLYLGALEIENPERRLVACFVILVAGRLGLRIAEIQHLREDWINWKRGEIYIPEMDPCACRQCWIQAYNKWGRQGLKELQDENSKWENRKWKKLLAEERKEVTEKADCCTSERLVDIVQNEQFSPKNESSPRVIPFGWSYRITACLMMFFNHFDVLDYEQNGINQLLKDCAENAGFPRESISAHPLRATCETFFADISDNPKMAKDLAGWRQIETAVNYFRVAGRLVSAKLYRLMGKSDEAPPVVPEEPADDFPIALNPIPFQNEPFSPIMPDGKAYDEEKRKERHRNEDEFVRLFNPREINLIHDTAGFPDKGEIHYDPDDHELPGPYDRDSDRVYYRHDPDDEYGELVTEATTLDDFTRPEQIDSGREVNDENYRVDWAQSQVGRYQEDDYDPASTVLNIGAAVVYSGLHSLRMLRNRLRKEWDEYWTVGDRGLRSTPELLKGIAIYFIGVVIPLALIFYLMF